MAAARDRRRIEGAPGDRRWRRALAERAARRLAVPVAANDAAPPAPALREAAPVPAASPGRRDRGWWHRLLARLRARGDRPPPPSARRTPTLPPGERVYAIGDVHGCADALRLLLERIEADDAARGPAHLTIVFLGDVIDRGPDSARALSYVRQLAADGTARLVKGNHEEVFVMAAQGDVAAARALIDNGGLATLESFGIPAAEAARTGVEGLPALLAARIAPDVVDFLDAAEDWLTIGDYLFVHAGIRPGVPLAQQQGRDLRWIREAFLEARGAHGHIVVHGHTIMPQVQERPNRIGIDTGAFLTGRLTALGLEGEARWYLDSAPEESAS